MLHDDSYKIVILNETSEFIMSTLTGELKLFDLETMIIKKIIYAFQGNITHLLANDRLFVSVGNEYNQRLGFSVKVKIFR